MSAVPSAHGEQHPIGWLPPDREARLIRLLARIARRVLDEEAAAGTAPATQQPDGPEPPDAA